MKRIFLIDWLLIPVFVLTSYTGIELHCASNHLVWHNWAVAHVIISFLFVLLVLCHIKTHWSWYRGIAKNGVRRKRRITFLVSVLFLFVTFTGFMLLGMQGPESNIGLWHYKGGLLSIVLFSGHILKRIPILRRSIKH